MKHIKDIIIDTIEPSMREVAWLKPVANGGYILYLFGNDGWKPLFNENKYSTEFIEEIPNIIINK